MRVQKELSVVSMDSQMEALSSSFDPCKCKEAVATEKRGKYSLTGLSVDAGTRTGHPSPPSEKQASKAERNLQGTDNIWSDIWTS